MKDFSLRSYPVKWLLLVLLLPFLLIQCRNKHKNSVFEVNPVQSLPPSAGKDKQKTTQQFISILYANLFQKALSANELVEITNCITSIGDKETAHEIVISNFMNHSDVRIPSNTEMRDDVDTFLDETYKRFFVRDITEAERAFFKDFIASNENVTPELVYFAFTLADEYNYY